MSTFLSSSIPQARRIVLGAAALLMIALSTLAVASPATAESRVVNVNSAGVGELALLPRVGPSVAERIVAYRDQNGRFKAAEELMLVRGIGEKTYELIAPYVTLTGNTTLSEKVRTSGGSAEPKNDS